VRNMRNGGREEHENPYRFGRKIEKCEPRILANRMRLVAWPRYSDFFDQSCPLDLDGRFFLKHSWIRSQPKKIDKTMI